MGKVVVGLLVEILVTVSGLVIDSSLNRFLSEAMCTNKKEKLVVHFTLFLRSKQGVRDKLTFIMTTKDSSQSLHSHNLLSNVQYIFCSSCSIAGVLPVVTYMISDAISKGNI